MTTESPFHPGEQALQHIVGVHEQAGRLGRAYIRGYMPDQHRAFYEGARLFYLGTQDAAGRVWASVLAGQPGFVSSPTPTRLLLSPGAHASTDPVSLSRGTKVGALGLDLTTRRRNRVNGTVTSVDADGTVVLQVDQAFGNCPKYISTRDVQLDAGALQQRRQAAAAQGRAASSGAASSSTQQETGPLGAPQAQLIAGADTFFLATCSSAHHFQQDANNLSAGSEPLPPPDEYREAAAAGCDVSHRGGPPGFVSVSAGGSLLRWPDYTGNNHFNSLGNLWLEPRCGLLFIDWASGDTLQLTGEATVLLDDRQAPGAQRMLQFQVAGWIHTRRGIPLAAPAPVIEASPFNPRLLLDASSQLLRVVAVEDEAQGIKTFHIQAPDAWHSAMAAGKHPYLPGQFASFDFDVLASSSEEQSTSTETRTWTISTHPAASVASGTFSISVKRAGLISSFMHDHVGVGAMMNFRGVGGSFTPDATSNKPVLLVAGGIGITPLRAMMHDLVRRGTPATLLYSVRSLEEAAFLGELAALASKGNEATEGRPGGTDGGASGSEQPKYRVAAAVTGPLHQSAHEPASYHRGRLSSDVILQAAPHAAACDVYMCGPPAFMAAMEEQLLAVGVAEQRLHTESFSF